MTECLSDETTAAYVDGRLEEADRRAVETHLVHCDRCLEQVALLKRVMDQEAALAGLEIPDAVLARAEALIAERFGRRPAVMDLAVRIAGSLVDVLRTTGEILTPDPAPVPVRGRRRKGGCARVHKRVENHDLVVEVESRASRPVLRVLLSQAETRLPVHGVRVVLSRASDSETRFTDSETRFTERGLADFGPRDPGHYRIGIEDVGDVDIDIESS